MLRSSQLSKKLTWHVADLLPQTVVKTQMMNITVIAAENAAIVVTTVDSDYQAQLIERYTG